MLLYSVTSRSVLLPVLGFRSWDFPAVTSRDSSFANLKIQSLIRSNSFHKNNLTQYRCARHKIAPILRGQDTGIDSFSLRILSKRQCIL